jgi:hypothetical protein
MNKFCVRPQKKNHLFTQCYKTVVSKREMANISINEIHLLTQRTVIGACIGQVNHTQAVDARQRRGQARSHAMCVYIYIMIHILARELYSK